MASSTLSMPVFPGSYIPSVRRENIPLFKPKQLEILIKLAVFEVKECRQHVERLEWLIDYYLCDGNKRYGFLVDQLLETRELLHEVESVKSMLLKQKFV